MTVQTRRRNGRSGGLPCRPRPEVDGQRTGAPIWVIVSSSLHHLKQLYAYMGMMGLEPVAPLGAEDFAGIAVPTELF
jgi:hypothetical protein